jgi:hypothetical protein
MIVNKQNPWMIVIRNNFSKVFSLRMGAGISYHTGKQKNRDYSPLFEPLGEYEYIRVPKILRTSIFTGLQYRKKFNSTYLYAFSDLLYNHTLDDDVLEEEGVKYSSTNIPRYSDVTTVKTHKYRINTWGGRQGLGLKIFLTQRIGLSVEGSITFEIENFTQERGYLWFTFYEDDPLSTSGGTYFLKVKDTNHYLNVNPFGLVMLSYHF